MDEKLQKKLREMSERINNLELAISYLEPIADELYIKQMNDEEIDGYA